MVKIVWYLPKYSDDVRWDDDIDSEGDIDASKQTFLDKYGFPTKSRSGRFDGGDGSGVRTYEWKSDTKASVQYYLKGKFSKGGVYNQEKDDFIVQLRYGTKKEKGLSYKRIADRFNQRFGEDKSWIAIRDRLARLEDRK